MPCLVEREDRRHLVEMLSEHLDEGAPVLPHTPRGEVVPEFAGLTAAPEEGDCEREEVRHAGARVHVVQRAPPDAGGMGAAAAPATPNAARTPELDPPLLVLALDVGQNQHAAGRVPREREAPGPRRGRPAAPRPNARRGWSAPHAAPRATGEVNVVGRLTRPPRADNDAGATAKLPRHGGSQLGGVRQERRTPRAVPTELPRVPSGVGTAAARRTGLAERRRWPGRGALGGDGPPLKLPQPAARVGPTAHRRDARRSRRPRRVSFDVVAVTDSRAVNLGPRDPRGLRRLPKPVPDPRVEGPLERARVSLPAVNEVQPCLALGARGAPDAPVETTERLDRAGQVEGVVLDRGPVATVRGARVDEVGPVTQIVEAYPALRARVDRRSSPGGRRRVRVRTHVAYLEAVLLRGEVGPGPRRPTRPSGARSAAQTPAATPASRRPPRPVSLPPTPRKAYQAARL